MYYPVTQWDGAHKLLAVNRKKVAHKVAAVGFLWFSKWFFIMFPKTDKGTRMY